MRVYGLVGASGTGKSYHAERIAVDLGVEFILDDGLLIHNNQIVAGFSAKFEANQIAAIKRAIFTDEVHRKTVQAGLARSQVQAVLVIGTSKRMVTTICSALELGAVMEWLPIEELTSEADMALARNLRTRGLHAIPIFQSQLEVAPLPAFIKKLKHRFLVQRSEVTVPSRNNLTVVSPLFNQGAIYIHPRVVKESIVQLMKEESYPFQMRRLKYNPDDERIIRLYVTATWERDLILHGQRLSRDVRSYLQEKLGLPYMRVNLHIDSITEPQSLLAPQK